MLESHTTSNIHIQTQISVIEFKHLLHKLTYDKKKIPIHTPMLISLKKPFFFHWGVNFFYFEMANVSIMLGVGITTLLNSPTQATKPSSPANNYKIHKT